MGFLPESPRYYYAKNQFAELRVVLSKFAKVNGADMGEFDIDTEKKTSNEYKGSLNKSECNASNSLLSSQCRSQEFNVILHLNHPGTRVNLV